MRLLVIGSKGNVARAISQIAPAYDVFVEARGRPALNILEAETIASAISEVQPDIIINTAAYTDVDAAERDQTAAFALNATGPGTAAAVAARMDVPFIHLSTECVFDGTKGSPYVETDPTGPLGVYGASKLAGEVEVAAHQPHHLILRTEWIYGASGKNFVRSILRQATLQPKLRIVDTQRGCPTAVEDLARGLLSIAMAIDGAQNNQVWGTLHIAAAGETTRFDFAREVMSISQKLGGPVSTLESVPVDEFPGAGLRPSDARLDCGKLARVYGVRLPDWHEGLERCLQALAANNWDLT